MQNKRILSLLLALGLLLTGLIGAMAVEVQTLEGTVAEVDKYGNLTLDITCDAAAAAGWLPGDVLTVTVGEETIEAPLGTAYSDVDTGSIVVRTKLTEGVGIIVAINMGNFGETYGVAAGDAIALALLTPGGYLDEYNMRQLAQMRTNVREDYADDAVFANFRAVSYGSIGEGVLYRASSPVNDELGRAAYANDLAEAAGIATVINLADSADVLEEYFAAEGFASDFYKGLYEADQVATLDMGVDFSADGFKDRLAFGLRFLAADTAPYLIHCNEGKDRAGFVLMLLEALMGASEEEITADYMLSFVNYYHVEVGSEQYEKVAESNVKSMLRDIAGIDKDADLSGVDLAATARAYLTGIGLSDEEIAALETALQG